MFLSIIIPSYNTRDLLKQCLESIVIQPFNHSDHEVIVVDNASTDGSPEMIRLKYPQVKLISNPQNVGFAQAVNTGLRQASGEYFLVLNSDTLFRKSTLTQLLNCLNQYHPEIASCRLVNPDGSLQPQGGFLPQLGNVCLWMLNLDNLPLLRLLAKPYQLRYSAFFSHDQAIGWVGGTAMIIKKSVFLALQNFDEHIFMYAEDIDFCYRAHLSGFTIRYFCQPVVVHLGQGSGTPENAVLGEFKGLIYLFKKYRPAWQLTVLKFFLRMGSLLRLMIFGMIGKHELQAVYQKAYHLV
jgi:GT2 family glycosyltransferase